MSMQDIIKHELSHQTTFADLRQTMTHQQQTPNCGPCMVKLPISFLIK